MRNLYPVVVVCDFRGLGAGFLHFLTIVGQPTNIHIVSDNNLNMREKNDKYFIECVSRFRIYCSDQDADYLYRAEVKLKHWYIKYWI